MRRSARILTTLATLLLLASAVSGPSGASAQSTHVVVDYVILIDVSGSMAGLPAGSGNFNIFPRVKQAVGAALADVQPGSRVYIAPFAERVLAVERFDIGGAADVQRAVAYVNGLNANGSDTHVYAAIEQTFGAYGSQRGADSSRVAAVMVFTDGKDNGPEHLPMQEVMRRFGLARKENDFLYYATLGRPLPAPDAAALVTDHSRYISNQTGEVHPPVVVQPLLGLLEFGNLLRQPNATRAEPFEVRGHGGSVHLRVSAEFPELASQGVFARLTPEDFAPSGDVSFGLSLLNAQTLAQGEYRGTLRFESDAPEVIVVPSRIHAHFLYAPPRTIRIVPAPGAARPVLSIGALDPFRAPDGRAAAEDHLRLEPDAEALAKGGSVLVRIRQDDGNPSHLPDSQLLINGRPGDMQTVDIAARKLEMAVHLTKSEAKRGGYRGTLVVEDGSVEVVGPREIPWHFTVAKPPPTPGAIALLALAILIAIGALVLFARYWSSGGLAAPVLRGRLTLRAPADEYGREIALTGRREVQLGGGADELERATARIRIYPERTRKAYRVKVAVLEGSVSLRHQGDPAELPIATETLEDGDQLAVQPYRIEYNRF